jgi:2-(1,2-epoxy-1,2-dihydrophenyl)acetyl-CoA isomerase
MSESQPVRYTLADGVATITLDRPEGMNSLDRATKDALLGAIDQAGADDLVRCVVITGSGRAFCVGQDLREHIADLSSKPMDEVWATVDAHFSPIALGIATMPKPVVAAVNGVAAGAGMSIALACDIRVAADTAGFNTAFTGVGLSCDTGSSWTLPRLVGPTKALDLLLMPRTVDAVEALEIGLVTRVVPAVELTEQVRQLAIRLAAGPTVAYAAVKESVAYSAAHGLRDSLAVESQMMARTGASADHRAAVQAFVEKLEPRFEGR